MLPNSRMILKGGSLLHSLALRQQRTSLRFRQLAVATGGNHLHFHQNQFKYGSAEDRVTTITGLLLGNSSSSSKMLFYQHPNLFLTSHSRCFSAQKVNSSASRSAGKGDEDKSKSIDAAKNDDEDEKPLGLVAKFKKMAKEYWYVLIPVHVVTSCFWFGGFYYASVSGFDIVGFMEHWSINEKLINPFRDSHLGHIAVAYLLYKVATPARYTVTLGGTTFAIRFLSQRGYIRPMPSKDKLLQMYNDRKDEMQQKVTDTKMQLQEKLKKDN